MLGSLKANALGIYDLGGNVGGWMLDGLEEKTGKRTLRGSDWNGVSTGTCAISLRISFPSL
jgi:formylglycine-generating enzyme required for sulfatase activity